MMCVSLFLITSARSAGGRFVPLALLSLFILSLLILIIALSSSPTASPFKIARFLLHFCLVLKCPHFLLLFRDLVSNQKFAGANRSEIGRFSVGNGLVLVVKWSSFGWSATRLLSPTAHAISLLSSHLPSPLTERALRPPQNFFKSVSFGFQQPYPQPFVTFPCLLCSFLPNHNPLATA
jgi:hypothetical protein